MTMTFSKTPLPPVDLIEDVPNQFIESGWFAKTAVQFLGNSKIIVLIHADDGVIWARIENDSLVISDHETTRLRSATIQQCRAFNEQGELFVWRISEGNWRGRVIVEPDEDCYSTDAGQALWGDIATPLDNDFSEIEEQALGLRQIVPICVTNDDLSDVRRVLLTVRNYISEDCDGQSMPMLGRLVKLKIGDLK